MVVSKSPDLGSSLATATNKVGGTGASVGNGSVDNASGVKGNQGFSDLLKTKIAEPSKPDVKTDKLDSKQDSLKFSQHALERMSSRGITFKPEELLRLNDAIEKAASKGSRESLVLMGDNALIVSVKNKTVVTAMDREAMKENVFTNIDSTVIL